MMAEIYNRGPIACFVASDPLENVTNWNIVTDKSTDRDHIVSVVGWGEENGVKYWIMRNSWGEYLGMEGWYRIERGNGGAVSIESDCAWANPKNIWNEKGEVIEEIIESEEKMENEVDKKLKEKFEEIFPQVGFSFKADLIPDEENPHSLDDLPDEVVISPKPEDYIDELELPEAHFWGNISGVNYLSWTVNQHVPQYCGSCWAQAAQSALADRINIMHNNKFPRIAMSVQQILNCAAGGTCEGGSLNGVYKWGHQHHLVEFGCRIYEARDPAGGAQCSPIQNCMNCKRNHETQQSQCWIVDNFRKWYSKEYGRVAGIEAMKKEIFARGPITCGMHVTDKFYNDYQGGIYSEIVAVTSPNHAVSVVGWGIEGKTEFWIVRNSWGTWWGEKGYF